MSKYTNTELLQYSEEVLDALNSGKPVVALESTVIAHGLPYPENVATAMKIEQAVRNEGAVPATVGIENGKFVIGMTEQDIDRFASVKGIPKTTSRDIPVILARRGMGATTVASSIVAADQAGVAFFASAGIGGVHRGAQKSMDISADLIQFTRSKVAVVCAGAKSILDLGLTLEYLETQCVPLIAWQSDDFPAFYCESSGYRSPHRMDDALEVASAIEHHWRLGNNSAVLITAPIDKENAIDRDEVEEIIQAAARQAEREGIRGPGATPYLMRAVAQATQGRTVKANMSVLISNAAVGARLAVAHAEFLRSGG
ncbi:pseudouridine-5'-phosphate glycosidase [Enterobacteriaceae bacterium YMB-R22]|uniref:Pseudouridine-5'-phosphate glycosidase n=3 Tax=Enterobacteriaceae TaxID=543 RepID=A0A8K0XZH5_9ENTR|nr:MULTISPECIES: pseudouridine-5'-phosphate glycosidase [Tenebrionibacter/Tenebrionicola group]MBK4715609.1 pseudouridine-5'-phosphate glycosidase [Tenebrionibacter intestinalis]MBV4412915.1 pseudouridine-5'-phosphate glycosidase [Tenebrionicola larvae]MBV5094607.1 pseudouridine-5'-phosphate glycosidase [Tenebrionicola larvae]